MRTIAAFLAVFGCAQTDGPRPPARPLNRDDARSLAEHLAYNTRRHRSYATTFTAVLEPPAPGDPIRYRGECVWAAPGILYVHYTASGGDEKRIVRAGKDVWVHHPFAGWVTGAEMGMAGAGQGLQNPDELLAVLVDHLDRARLADPGVVRLTFEGRDIRRVMREHGDQGGFDWDDSTATLLLHADDKTRLKRFECEADLAPREGGGRVKYAAALDVTGYDTAASLTFTDDEKKPIPLSPKMREAIQAMTGKEIE